MPEQRQTKNQRREAAREEARAQREKQKRRDKLLRWMIPSIATVAVLAIAAAVVWVFVINAPEPPSAEGPRNMISDGILFEGVDGAVTPVETGGIAPTGEPEPTETEDDGLAHIVTYVDFSCPACKSFEETYSTQIDALVAAGVATLEVHPIAILDRSYAGSRYSSRSNNVAACVADLAPESFRDVMVAMYAQQPDEGTTGLSNDEIIDVVHSAGLEDEAVDECISNETFSPWVTAATTRATTNADLIPAGAQGLSTPTVVVNGEIWDRSIDVMQFIQSKITLTETPEG